MDRQWVVIDDPSGGSRQNLPKGSGAVSIQRKDLIPQITMLHMHPKGLVGLRKELLAASSGYVDPGAGNPVQPGWSRCQLQASHQEKNICFSSPCFPPTSPPNHPQHLPRNSPKPPRSLPRTSPESPQKNPRSAPDRPQTDPRPTPDLP